MRGDHPLGERGGAVPRLEGRRVHGAAVGGGGERPRGVGKQGDHCEGVAGQGRPQVLGVEDPDVRSSHPGGGELRVAAGVLPPMGGGDERPIVPLAGENDVPRLVPDQQGAHHPRSVAPLDHADAVGEVVDHPDLARLALGHRHRLEPHSHRSRQLEGPVVLDPEDLQAVVGRVDGIEVPAVSGQRQRTHLSALELGEGLPGRRRVERLDDRPRGLPVEPRGAPQGSRDQGGGSETAQLGFHRAPSCQMGEGTRLPGGCRPPSTQRLPLSSVTVGDRPAGAADCHDPVAATGAAMGDPERMRSMV
jgi:hypothetical protein